ncbi:hypothetical protein DXG01_000785 [Tephrocybe rancida]|nr:hypothetical protein DXG01_000785 [Tephrocybe rancida]
MFSHLSHFSPNYNHAGNPPTTASNTPPHTPPGDALTGSSFQSTAGPTAPTSTTAPGPPAKKKPPKKPPKKAPSTPPKPKQPSDWHLCKLQVPEGSKRTKTTYKLHLRTLWELMTQYSIPPQVTDADKAPFMRRFTSEEQVRQTITSSLDDHSTLINDCTQQVTAFRASLLETNIIISGNMQRIQTEAMLLMFRMVAILGLPRWALDVLSADPDSMYNLLHEYIAYVTFKQAAVAHGYAHMGINLEFVEKFGLMRKFYRSFVFSYMHKTTKSEVKSPRSMLKAKQMTPIWKRHAELAKGQLEVLMAQGFKPQIIALAQENEAHSDDELTADGPVYYIKNKEGRLQKNNLMTIRERADCHAADGQYHVALPLEQFCMSWAECVKWKNLSDAEFMERYGKNVLEEYILPTEEELKQMEEWEARYGYEDNEICTY